MRKIVLLMFVLSWLLPTSAADYKVGTDVTKKKILLEEFTGISCGNCPDGHKKASQLLNAFPEQAYCVAIHAGSYSTPGSSGFDFRTAEGDVLSEHFATEMAGYPCGMVNRHDFGGNQFLYGRQQWLSLANVTASEDAPVNLYVEAEYNGEAKTLGIHVEGYFTSTPSMESPSLCVLWTQDAIIGPQNGSLDFNEYEHNHVLRGYITDVHGDAIADATAGSYFTRDYSIELPADVKGIGVKPEDINVIAFVSDGLDEVANVEGCKPSYIKYNETEAGYLLKPDMEVGTKYGYNFFEVYVKNSSSATISSASFEVTVNGVAQAQTVACNIPQFGKQLLKVPAAISYATGRTKYAVKLTALNGVTVEPSELSGSFQKPAVCGTTVKVDITTDRSAAQNRFMLKDADGNIVKEFGPFENNKPNTFSETVSLEDGKTYCIEVTDINGDGLLDGERGSLLVHDANGKLIDQFYSITGFGVRSFFIVDSSTGISDTKVPGGTPEYFTLGGLRVAGDAVPAGLVIVKDGNGVRKAVVGRR